jgi:hypothetical protein
MVRRPVQELMARACHGAIGFRKDALDPEEVDYLKGLQSFLVETDEFIFTRNPVIGSLPATDPESAEQ